MKNINGAELRDIVANNSDAVIVDVRTIEEVQGGKIEGAIHIDLMSPEFPEKIKELDTSGTYIMVCRSGNRSGSACGFMSGNGFTNIYNLEGGLMYWDGETV